MIKDIWEQNLAYTPYKICALMTDDTGLLDTNSSRQGFSFEHETKMKERKAYENFSAI